MDTNKILSADLLDLIFDNRNKDYGAYELRKNYHVRVTKALVFGGLFVVIVFTGVVMANKTQSKEINLLDNHVVTLVSIPDDVEPEPIPEPPRRLEPPPVATIQNTEYDIVDDTQVVEPPPTRDDLMNALTDTRTTDGEPYVGIIPIKELDGETGIIAEPEIENEDPLWEVDEDATYEGWGKFLERNLRAGVPVDNGAPPGDYTVIILFVVDPDGSISGIKPLTNHGYGLEQEAIRVIKKATKWKPAFQKGRPVKAYRKQPITFRIEGEE